MPRPRSHDGPTNGIVGYLSLQFRSAATGVEHVSLYNSGTARPAADRTHERSIQMTKRSGAWLLIGLAAVFAVVALGAMAAGQTSEAPSAAVSVVPDVVGTTAAPAVVSTTEPPPVEVSAESNVNANLTPPTTEASTTETTPPVATAPVFVGKPVRVRIPQIGVDADVIDLGLRDDGTLEVPSNFAETGWYTGRSVSGEPGPSVVVGHVDSKSGPAVFYHLDDLEAGHTIEIHRSDGSVAFFRVSSSVLVDKDEFPTDQVYGSTDEPTLRLITCGGDFNSSVRSYEGNLIVFAEHLGNSEPLAESQPS